MPRRKTADLHAEGKEPPNWDKWVNCAYLRLIGQTQEEAAKNAGVSVRSLRTWENEHKELYHAAKNEARRRWLNETTDDAMRAVGSALRMGNAELGKWWLERVVPELGPPMAKHANLNLDLKQLSNTQLQRIANGEHPLAVLATTENSGTGGD